jgi:hypothetical protein
MANAKVLSNVQSTFENKKTIAEYLKELDLKLEDVVEVSSIIMAVEGQDAIRNSMMTTIGHKGIIAIAKMFIEGIARIDDQDLKEDALVIMQAAIQRELLNMNPDEKEASLEKITDKKMTERLKNIYEQLRDNPTEQSTHLGKQLLKLVEEVDYAMFSEEQHSYINKIRQLLIEGKKGKEYLC